MSVRLDALIFDLDGTLADSLADIALATNEVLAAHGLAPHPVEAYKQFVGEGAEVLLRRAFVAAQGQDWHDAALLPRAARLADLAERYRVAYEKLEHANSQPYAGVDRLLDAVVKSGRKMAVLSNKRDDFTKHLIAHRFGRWPFADVRGEREGVPRKPDPTAALELALVLNVLPERIGFVGDTPIDVRTAKNAGMVSIGVLWGFRSRQELDAAGARITVERPDDLAALL